MANLPTKHKSFRVGLNFLGVATILCTSFLASSGTVKAGSMNSMVQHLTNKNGPMPILALIHKLLLRCTTPITLKTFLCPMEFCI